MQIVPVLAKPIAAESDPGESRPNTASRAPGSLIAWVLVCTFCNCAGWILSAFHLLNLLGYAVSAVLCVLLAFIFRRGIFSASRPGSKLIRLKRRFRRPFPLSFFVLATLAV